LSFFNSGSWAMIWLSFKSAFTVCFPHGNSQLWPTHHYHKSHLPSQLLCLSITNICHPLLRLVQQMTLYPLISLQWHKTLLCHFSQICLLTLLNDILKARGYHLPVLYQQLISPFQVLSVLSTCIPVTILYSSCLPSPERSLSTVDNWLWPEIWGPNSCSITGNCYSTVTITFLTWMDQTFLAGSPPYHWHLSIPTHSQHLGHQLYIAHPGASVSQAPSINLKTGTGKGGRLLMSIRNREQQSNHIC
jgi:hypothetical protein